MLKINQLLNRIMRRIDLLPNKMLLNKNKKMENYLLKVIKKLFYLIYLLNQGDKQRKDHKIESECHLNLFKKK